MRVFRYGIGPLRRWVHSLRESVCYGLRHLRSVHLSFAYDVIMASATPWFVFVAQNAHFSVPFPAACYGMMGLTASAFLFWIQSYRTSWMFFSIFDLAILFKTAAFTVLVGTPILNHMVILEHPRLFAVMHVVILCFFWSLPRCLVRTFSSQHYRFLGLWPAPSAQDGRRVLWVGTDAVLDLRLQALTARAIPASFLSVGIITSNVRLEGQSIDGVPVLGTVEHLDHVVHHLTQQGKRPHELWFVPESLSPAEIKRLHTQGAALHISVQKAPDALCHCPAQTMPALPLHHAVEALLGRPPLRFSPKGIQSFLYHKRLVIAHLDLCSLPWLEALMAYCPDRVFFLDHHPERLGNLQSAVRAQPWAHQCTFMLAATPEHIPLDLWGWGPVDLLLSFPPYDISCCEESMYAHATWSHLGWLEALSTVGMHIGCDAHLYITPDLTHLTSQPFEAALGAFCESFWCSMNATAQHRSLNSRFLTLRIPYVLSPTQGFMREVAQHSHQDPVWHLHTYETAPFVSDQEMKNLLLAMMSMIPKMDGDDRQTLCAIDIPVQSTLDLLRRRVELSPEHHQGWDIPQAVFSIRPSQPITRTPVFTPTPSKSLAYLQREPQNFEILIRYAKVIQDRLKDASPPEVFHLLIEAVESSRQDINTL